MRKYTYNLFKSFNKGAKARDQDFIDIKKGIEEVFERQRGVMNRRHEKVGDGKGRLELYGQEGGGCHSKFAPKNKRRSRKRRRRKQFYYPHWGNIGDLDRMIISYRTVINDGRKESSA